MFKSKKKRGRPEADEPLRGDIGLAAEDVSEDAAAEEPFDDSGGQGMPEAGAPAEPTPLERDSDASRREAERRNRRDDRTRMAVFSCACAIAGFCGVAGVIFGTVTVCRGLGDSGSLAASPLPPGYVQGVDPSDMNIYYDEAGRMHVNVYLAKQPDMDINIHIDKDGNVVSEFVPSEGADQGDGDADADSGDASQDGTSTTEPSGDSQAGIVPDTGAQEPGGASQPPAGNGEGGDDGDGDGDPNGPQDPSGNDIVQQPADIPKTEAEILAEQEQRREDGGSGYSENDVQYVVKRGDTLGGISNKVGFSVDFLAAYNGLRDRNMIITGEVLRYPSFD